MTERRRSDPLPLGGDEPYSKGLMARALIRAGAGTHFDPAVVEALFGEECSAYVAAAAREE